MFSLQSWTNGPPRRWLRVRNPAARLTQEVPWLCVPPSREVCLFDCGGSQIFFGRQVTVYKRIVNDSNGPQIVCNHLRRMRLHPSARTAITINQAQKCAIAQRNGPSSSVPFPGRPRPRRANPPVTRRDRAPKKIYRKPLPKGEGNPLHPEPSRRTATKLHGVALEVSTTG